MKKPLMNQFYASISGKLIYVITFGTHYKTDSEIVIFKDISTNKLKFIPIEDFFTKHPTTGKERYTHIIPQN